MPAEWNGSVIVWPKRILFVGEAAKSRVHASHTLMIVIACGGTFKLKIGPKGRWQSFTAAMIDAGTEHCMDGKMGDEGEDFVAIIHLLPETLEARELRREYLAKRGWYGIPTGPARRLSKRLEGLKNYRQLKCKAANEFCEQVIGGFIDSPSTRLDREVDPQVRRAIDELYARVAHRLKHGRSPKDFFTASSVAAAIHLPETGKGGEELARMLKRKFRESTGASFNQYVKLLRFRATLAKLALITADLRAASKGQKVDVRQRRSARRLSLSAAATWMGWGKPYNLTHASIEILGISPNSLRMDSGFYNCRTPPRQ